MYTSAMHKAALQFANQTIAEEQTAAITEKRKVRPDIMGAKLYHHPGDPDGVMRQYILKNALGVSYEHPFDDLPTYQPEIVSPLFPSLLKSAQPCETFRSHVLPPLDYLKQLWKWARQKWYGGIKPNCRYKMFSAEDEPGCLSVVVDIRLLVQAMTLIGCKGGEAFYFKNALSSVMIESDGAECVLMPLRTMDYNDSLNDMHRLAEFRRWKTLNG